MRISGFSTVRPNMNSTRTYEDFMKFLGANPSRLGIVSTLYDQYTASHLTEALMNTYTKGQGKKAMKSINSYLIEWNLKVSKIKRLPMIQEPVGDGANASDITFYFGERYYEKNDTFIIENTRQQFFVTSRPQRLRDNCWAVTAKIVDNDYDSTLINKNALVGLQTRFVTNYQPEFHSEGSIKYQSNIESMRTYIATHRCDVDMSSQYASMEDVFIRIGKGNELKDSDPVYKLNTAEKDLIDSFMMVRNNALLWGRSNVDANGKTKFSTEDGRPIVTADGIIAQIERFADKYVFSNMNMRYFERALQSMVAKSEKATGNQYVMLCNTAFYTEWQRAMGSWIGDHHTDGAYLYSKAANGMVNLGATYEAYTFGANTISCKLDRSLDVEFPNRKYAVLLDLTSDSSTGKPAMEFYTFKGADFVRNTIKGVNEHKFTCAAA